MKFGLRIAIAILCVALPTVPLATWLAWVARAGQVDSRVRLAGQPVGENAGRAEMWVSERMLDRLSSHVALKLPQVTVTASLEDLGFVPETGATMEGLLEASRASHSGDPVWSIEHFRKLEAGAIEVPLVIGLEPGVLIEYLLDLKTRHDLPPREARIDFATGTITGHESGASLEIYSAAAVIEKAVLVDGASSVTLPMAEIEPALTADVLASLDHETVISEFSTTFPRAGKNSSRAHNVAFAASKLDGTILLPGITVSFNAIVGERSIEAGFMEAPEIYEGEMVEGVGGGTCQVSSTLHAALVYAGLDIVERYPHSRPSSYIRMGLDATVAYPTVDLRVRNPFPIPLVVRAFTQKGRLTVQILGATRPVTVDFDTSIMRTDPFDEVIEEDPSMQVGVVLVKQYGLPGYQLRRVRTITYSDGTVKTEKTIDMYPATSHLVVVNPATGYTGLTAAQKGIEAQDPDEGVLEGEDLEERPADFAAPEPAEEPATPAWTIVDGPFAHPPKPEAH